MGLPLPSRRWLALPLLAALALAATLAVRGRRREPGLVSQLSSSPGDAPHIFKRTFASAAARLDARFVWENFGLAWATNATYADGDGACATREVLRALGGWELHYFESRVTPSGNRTVASWMDAIAARQANLSDWNAFDDNVVTYYAPDAGPFVERLASNGVPSLRVRSRDPSGDVVFGVFAASPHSGHLVEVVSEFASSGGFAALDDDVPAAACAVAPRRNVSELNATWTRLGGTWDARGLPDLLAVGTSVAVSDAAPWVAFLRGATLEGASLAAAPGVAGDSCKSTVVTLPFSTEVSALVGHGSLSYDLDVAFVMSREAARDLGALEDDVQRAHHRYTGLDAGWDRWLDSHLGIQLPGVALDDVAALLTEWDRPFAAHLNDASSEAGSLWTAGPATSSVGVEFKGTYDSSFLDSLTTLDYCAADGDGDATASQSGRVGHRRAAARD